MNLQSDFNDPTPLSAHKIDGMLLLTPKRFIQVRPLELHDVHTRRTTVLHAHPVYLREETSGFLRTCVDDTNEPDLRDAAVVLLTTITNDAESPVTYDPVRICYPRG
ncbi:uncharacterized protein [Nothobranchius furzeri]